MTLQIFLTALFGAFALFLGGALSQKQAYKLATIKKCQFSEEQLKVKVRQADFLAMVLKYSSMMVTMVVLYEASTEWLLKTL